MKFIDSYYNENITVADIDKKVNVIRDYLYKLFKRFSSLSPQEYMIKVKFHHAEKLLETTDDPFPTLYPSAVFKIPPILPDVLKENTAFTL